MSVYLFHSSLSLSTAGREIQYDEALRLRREGHAVYLLYCNSVMSQCFNNILGDKALCYLCRSNYKREKKVFGDQINFIPLSNLISDKTINDIHKSKFNYKTVEEIKKIEYKNINIGIGALSGYISKSRNLSPLIDHKFRTFFDHNLFNAMITTEAVLKAVEAYRPDHIVIYNGRFADSRPVWQIADSMNIPFTTLEAVYGVNKNYKTKFENATAHSIDNNTKLINHYWDNSKLSFESKFKIGSSFFERRRKGLFSGDKIYVKNQRKNLLPLGWDHSKKNVVIFNSSEDEFAAIGDEYDKYKLFKSQLEGLQFIKKHFEHNSEINFTLRIHPNLSKVKYLYATDLLKLSSDNFHVIDGGSEVSSYTLIDNADTIIVFGSTIGIEAVYWNKPTILLAGAMYYKLDSCYIPKSPDELIKLIQKNLSPKEKIGAVKYGYYLLNEEREDYSVYDYNWTTKEIKIFNTKKNIEIRSSRRLLGSMTLYSLYEIAKYKIIKRYFSFKKNKGIRFNLPVKEKRL